MLIGCVLLISVLAALALCNSLGGFADLSWLWQLPVGFIASFLLLAAAMFGLFVLICARIDPDKPRDADSPWFRWFLMQLIHAVVTVLPVRVHTRGTEKIPKQGRFLLVSNHLDNIDPAIFYYVFPKSRLAFVGKKETRDMFLVNKAMPKLLCPTINRENDREALKTILRCVQLLKSDTVSVAVFPEGRINPYRKLAHFRPGVFKIAQKANVPIVVCTLQGSDHVLPRLMKGKGSKVELHLLDVIQPEQLQGKTTVEIAQQIYDMMAQDLGAENILTPEEEENT